MPRDFRSSIARVAAFAFVTMMFMRSSAAQDESYKPDVAKATAEPQKAIKSIRPLPGFKVDLFAAEPLIANPVAFHIDEKGKFYVVETFRHSDGVTDTRGHMNWLDADLGARTVADRVAMYKKFLSPEDFAKYSKEQDRIRLVEDRDGDGKADHATIFADGFSLTETGLAAGVLARNGDVYFTCIPDLWLLKDTNGDGKADERKSLHTGYGVHVGFLGHDLHGLIFGPDGKLYFSIGDRGFNVKTWDGKELAVIDCGSVLRCDPDGKNLEVVATGLRNPQELAFNEVGDLFTVDNNSDGGDKARLVQIIEGADSGWRIGYQFIEKPNSRGIWNSEKMWHPAWEGQAAYILPPLANFTDGPSGLTYYPGTGLNASQQGRFYISDFRGASSSSGIRSFKVKPKGATYEIADPEQFLWGFEVTDCDFGPDGALYAIDWVEGWNKNGKGRIWKVTAPEMEKDPLVAETKKLIGEGFEKRSTEELGKLLGHADMRVRQGSQFVLVDRLLASRPMVQHAEGANGDLAKVEAAQKVYEDALTTLQTIAKSGEGFARFHALWGQGQILRDSSDDQRTKLLEAILPLFQDKDAEVRTQAARVAAEAVITPVSAYVALLKDESPRVRSAALLSLAKSKSTLDVVAPLVDLIRTDDGRDPYLRHAAVRALTRTLVGDVKAKEAIWALSNDPSANVRMAVLLTMRARSDAAVARFLDDSDPAIVLEAARCITECYGMAEVQPKLAALANRTNLSEPLWRRVIAACRGPFVSADPKALASITVRNDVPEAIRVEALERLAEWSKPSPRHPITGLIRHSQERPAAEAIAALLPVFPQLVTNAPDSVRNAAAKAAGTLGLKDAGPTLRTLVTDGAKPAESRVEALRALDALKDEKLGEVAQAILKDADPSVRVEAVRVVAKSNPDAAINLIQGVLGSGPVLEKQGAFATLAEIKDAKADAMLNVWLDKLATGEVSPEIRLDLTEAAAKRDLKDKLAKYEATTSKDDPLSTFRDVLVGGNAARGRKVFREKAEVQCLRCHKVDGDGGEVGPELTGIVPKKDRAYILESIVLPNKQIAQGFETQVIAKSDGQIVSGIVKGEDDKEVRLMTAEGKLVTVLKADIDEKARGNSAMPEDIIKSLTKTELRDVIEFLASTKLPASP